MTANHPLNARARWVGDPGNLITQASEVAENVDEITVEVDDTFGSMVSTDGTSSGSLHFGFAASVEYVSRQKHVDYDHSDDGLVSMRESDDDDEESYDELLRPKFMKMEIQPSPPPLPSTLSSATNNSSLLQRRTERLRKKGLDGSLGDGISENYKTSFILKETED